MGFTFFLITSLGMVLVFEGLFYALFPEKFKKMAAQMISMDEKHLRMVGGSMICLGVILVYIFKLLL